MSTTVICAVCTVATTIMSFLALAFKISRNCVTKEDLKAWTDTIDDKFTAIQQSLKETNKRFDNANEQMGSLRERIAVLEAFHKEGRT